MLQRFELCMRIYFLKNRSQIILDAESWEINNFLQTGMARYRILSSQVMPEWFLFPNRERCCDLLQLIVLGKKVSMFRIKFSQFTFFFAYHNTHHFLKYMNTNPIHVHLPTSFSNVRTWLKTQFPIFHVLSAGHWTSLFMSSLHTPTALFCYKLSISASNIKSCPSRSS